jgi:DNA polymerase-3 subunit delta
MIYLYYGENSFLIQEKLSAIRAKYEAKFSSGLNFWKLDLEEDFDNLKSIVDSQSMFEEKKLAFLRGIFSVTEARWEEIKKIILNIEKSDDVILVFYDFLIPKENAKKRLEFLSKAGKSDEFRNFERPKFISWILEKSKFVGLKMERNEAWYLADNIGIDLYRASSEILKLASYKNNSVLTKKDIDAVVPFETYANNFKAMDAVLNKNAVLALKGLEEQWIKNEDPIKILGAFAWQFRILLKLTDLKYSSFDEASKKLGVPVWSVKKSFSALKIFSFQELKNIYQKLADVDLAVKTGAEDGREALADFVCGFTKM